MSLSNAKTTNAKTTNAKTTNAKTTNAKTTNAKITNSGNKKCADCNCDIYFTSIRCPQCENNKRIKYFNTRA